MRWMVGLFVAVMLMGAPMAMNSQTAASMAYDRATRGTPPKQVKSNLPKLIDQATKSAKMTSNLPKLVDQATKPAQKLRAGGR